MYEEYKWIKSYVQSEGYDLDKAVQPVLDRQGGKVYTKRDHLQSMILSLLSANRPWVQIEQNLGNLDEIFKNYDPEFLRSSDPDDLEIQVCSIGCGNRRIHAQMQELRNNIGVLDKIEREFGTCDGLVHLASEHNAVMRIAYMLSNVDSSYKLKGMGMPLVLQYMKQLGVDCVKPDVHVVRILQRLGYFSYEPDVYETELKCVEIAKENNTFVCEVGTVLWTFCATGYCEMCGATPKCGVCPVCCDGNVTDNIQHIRDLVVWRKFFSKVEIDTLLCEQLVKDIMDKAGSDDLHLMCQVIEKEYI